MLVLKSLWRPRRPLVDPVVGLTTRLRDDDVFKFARLEVFSRRKAERNFSLLDPDDSVPTDGGVDRLPSPDILIGGTNWVGAKRHALATAVCQQDGITGSQNVAFSAR